MYSNIIIDILEKNMYDLRSRNVMYNLQVIIQHFANVHVFLSQRNRINNRWIVLLETSTIPIISI